MDPLQPVAAADRDPKLVFIGIPAAGDPLWSTARVLASLEIAPNDKGLRFIIRKVGGQGVAKARNILTYMARCSGAGEMVLADSDVKFGPEHVFHIVEHPDLFVGALYPKKQVPFSWVGEFDSANPAAMHPRGLWPMISVGGGFLKVNLEVVDSMIEEFPERGYESDEEAAVVGLVKGQWMHDLFGMGVIKDNWFGREFPRYITEDYYFSQLWRRMGGKCWVDPNCQVGHVGQIDYLDLVALIESEKQKAVQAFMATMPRPHVNGGRRSAFQPPRPKRGARRPT